MTSIGIDGLASGIKSNEIIDAMIAASRASTKVLESRRDLFSARLEAVRKYNTRLLTAQIDVAALKRPSTFQARAATSSNAAALSATAGNTAVPGTYVLDVTSVAAAHQIATAGQASASGAIGAGTISIGVGTGAQTTIDLSSTPASLDGIATAINGSGAAVSATVVQAEDGHRLVLQSKTTGEANTIAISATDGLAALFGAGNLQTLRSGADAAVRIGSGGTPITVKQATDTFTGVVPGVTLVAKQLASGIAVTVGTDTAAAADAVETAVGSINAAITYLRDNSSYDPDTRQAGALFSETSLKRGLDGLVRSFLDAVPGLAAGMASATAVGIGYDRTSGTLTIDRATLERKLSEDPEGVTKLFTSGGTSSTAGIGFVSLNDRTAVGPHAVTITQAAEQARVSGTFDLAETTVISSANNALSLLVNDTPLNITLADGSYSRAELAEHLQNTINAALPRRGDWVSVGLVGDRLDLRTQQYGSSRSIQVTGGNAQTALFLDLAAAQGKDVAGTIGGVAAVGAGQVLTAAQGTPAAGLSLLVTASTPIANATFTVRKGVGQMVGERLVGLTDARTGSVTQTENAFTASIDGMNRQIAKADERLAIRRTRLALQFSRMEKLIQQFQSQGNFISNQVAAFQAAAAK